jgi:hypothetical protein
MGDGQQGLVADNLATIAESKFETHTASYEQSTRGKPWWPCWPFVTRWIAGRGDSEVCGVCGRWREGLWEW